MEFILPFTRRTCFVLAFFVTFTLQESSDIPMFGGLINNVTVSVTRDATLSCIVENLSSYKVAWLRVDTQTILTIANHVITKNHRIAVTHSDHTWSLHIKDVKQTDQGWYMCQLNTDPMKSQTAYLEVVVPPDIIDDSTSVDMIVREGNDVTLRCTATGSPVPTVLWRREESKGNGFSKISLGNGSYVLTVDGPVLHIPKVTRQDMGAYLCIASNGIPPTISKRILLLVNFPPNIKAGKQSVGAAENFPVSLECHSEAFPKAINYWTRDKGEILTEGTKYEILIEESSFKVAMRLNIRNVTSKDFGIYKCVSKNSLGDTEVAIEVYRVPYSAISSRSISRNSKSNRLDRNLGVDDITGIEMRDESDGNGINDFLDYGNSASSVTFKIPFLALIFKDCLIIHKLLHFLLM